jgi:hypothetical protein
LDVNAVQAATPNGFGRFGCSRAWPFNVSHNNLPCRKCQQWTPWESNPSRSVQRRCASPPHSEALGRHVGLLIRSRPGCQAPSLAGRKVLRDGIEPPTRGSSGPRSTTELPKQKCRGLASPLGEVLRPQGAFSRKEISCVNSRARLPSQRGPGPTGHSDTRVQDRIRTCMEGSCSPSHRLSATCTYRHGRIRTYNYTLQRRGFCQLNYVSMCG